MLPFIYILEVVLEAELMQMMQMIDTQSGEKHSSFFILLFLLLFTGQHIYHL